MPPDEMDRPPEICEAWSDDYLQQPWLSACATRSPACAGPSAEGEEMAEAREASDVEALGEVMLIQGTMQRQFLRIVLRRLATDLPPSMPSCFLRRSISCARAWQTGANARRCTPCAEGMGEAFGDGARRDRLDPRQARTALGLEPDRLACPPRHYDCVPPRRAVISLHLSGVP